MLVGGLQAEAALEGKLRTQLQGGRIHKMGHTTRDAVHRRDGIHEDGRASTISGSVIPITLCLVVVAAVDVDHSVFIQMIAIEGIGQQLTVHGLQPRLRVDIHVVCVGENRRIRHPDDLHIMGVDDIVAHVVVGAHAIELQGVLLGDKRDKLGGVAMDGQQLFMCRCRGIIAEALHWVE